MGEDATRERRRVVRVDVASAAKVGGTVGCIVGAVGGAVWGGVVVAQHGAPGGGELALVALTPLLGLGVVGLDGLLLAALAAWGFNLTAWLSGGLVLELDAPEAPAPDA